MTARRSSTGVWIRRVAVAVVVLVCVYLVWMIWDRASVLDWLRRAPPLVFFGAVAILPALGVPFTPLFLLAGATFAVPLAIVGSLVALFVNVTLSYWLARSALRPRLVAALARLDYELPELEGDARSALRLTVLTKLAPGVPGFVKNYGLAAAGVPFAMYAVSSLVVTGAYATLLIIVGESLLSHHLRSSVVALLAVGAVVIVLGFFISRRRGRPRSADAQLPAAPALRT